MQGKIIGSWKYLALILWLVGSQVQAQQSNTRALSGVIITPQNEAVPGATVIVASASSRQKALSDAGGAFRFVVPAEPLVLRVEGKYITAREQPIGLSDPSENLTIEIEYIIPSIHEGLVIEASALDPGNERRNETVYKNTLFSRDDQVFHTLNAGINAGQHEGGGKSLEIRRFGYNLDHGGVSGGLKVLVDNVQQNQGTQGHGQGYLGQLKSLTPELVQDVTILNGPFSAAYGDFSGLGVVHIRLREALADQVTARFQGGTFHSARSFLAYSPKLKAGAAFIAYEASRTDGPFLNPLRYKRDNATGNYTWRLREGEALGFKLNLGRNEFVSSGQVPLDEVAAGRLDRFGFIDPDNGGRVGNGTLGAYYRKEWASGDIVKLDGFVSRSLFDLYSNFTFFLNDEINGDEIQQHDSRLQQGTNAQWLHPYALVGQRALVTAGSNFHDNQITVGLSRTVSRNPIAVTTRANAHVTNAAGYVQHAIDFMHGHGHVEAGLRYDYFRFGVDDTVNPSLSGVQAATRFQPKATVAYTPTDRIPLTVYFNYGRGISSQDARGVVQQPSGPRVATTDFYQVGTAHNTRRFSLSTDLFLIDRSNEQVYVPDDGSLEFRGPSRAYGFEVKSSVKLARHVMLDGGMTKVGNAFYRGTSPRVYVDSAPHVVANAALTMADWRGFSGSLRFRYINSYRLDGGDPSLRASGLTVLDFSLVKRIRRWVDFNLSVDNLTNKKYFETQNYFASRLRPGGPVIARIHGTPGYPITVTVGLTFRVLGKD